LSEKEITSNLPPNQIEPNLVTKQYFHTVTKDEIKIKSDFFNSKTNHNICSLNNENLSSSNDNYSNKHKSKLSCTNNYYSTFKTIMNRYCTNLYYYYDYSQ